ncbi:MAG: hypothetical protein M0P47_11175 [Bacteroidales bacterium]|nr:hypothetical protein [Bacteroidales bacterium]
MENHARGARSHFNTTGNLKSHLTSHQNQNTPNYTYDKHGNMLAMPSLTSMARDCNDRLKSSVKGSYTTWYCYDLEGNRTRKITDKGTFVEERIYLNGYEVYRKITSGTVTFERQSLHIDDDKKRVALVETKTIDSPPPTITSIIRYQYDNHLGSACLELDTSAEIITYEEYHPFGTTSYRSGSSEAEVSLKRYKYVGKERDEESGLYYYGARYYAAWIARFVSVDPSAIHSLSKSPFIYVSDNPVSKIDPSGRTDFYSNKGNWIGTDGNRNDNRMVFVYDKKQELSIIQASEQGKDFTTKLSGKTFEINRDIVSESVRVHTEAISHNNEIQSVMHQTSNFHYTGPDALTEGPEINYDNISANTGKQPDPGDVFIHSHPLGFKWDPTYSIRSAPVGKVNPADQGFFVQYKINVIIEKSKQINSLPDGYDRTKRITETYDSSVPDVMRVFDENSNMLGELDMNAARQALDNNNHLHRKYDKKNKE